MKLADRVYILSSRKPRKETRYLVIHRIGGTSVVGHKPDQVMRFFTTHPEGVATVLLKHSARKKRIAEWTKSGVPEIARKSAYVPYHFLIGPSGEIVQYLDEHAIGAAQAPVNRCSVGIGVIGDFRTKEPQVEQLGALDVLLANLMDIYPDAGVRGHDDVRPEEWGRKRCPGQHLDIREAEISAREILKMRRQK